MVNLDHMISLQRVEKKYGGYVTMDPSGKLLLETEQTVVGVLFVIVRILVKLYEKEKTQELIESETFQLVQDMVVDRDLDYTLIQSLYDEVYDIQEPKKNLLKAWIFTLFSGAFFYISRDFRVGFYTYLFFLIPFGINILWSYYDAGFILLLHSISK